MTHAPSSIPQNLTSVAISVVRRAVPGAAVGLFLGMLSLVSFAPGIKISAQDLLNHATHVHPFILVLAGAILSLAVLVQGGDFGEDLENWMITPALEFSSHLFSIGLGALLPLGLFLEGPWGIGLCEKSLGIISTAIVLAVMALLATAGLSIVEHRVVARERAVNSDSAKADVPDTAVASKWELRLFFGIFVACFAATLWAASLTEGTNELLHSAYHRLANKGCSPH